MQNASQECIGQNNNGKRQLTNNCLVVKGFLTVCAVYAQFSEDQNSVLSPEVPFV